MAAAQRTGLAIRKCRPALHDLQHEPEVFASRRQPGDVRFQEAACFQFDAMAGTQGAEVSTFLYGLGVQRRSLGGLRRLFLHRREKLIQRPLLLHEVRAGELQVVADNRRVAAIGHRVESSLCGVQFRLGVSEQ